MPRWSKTSQSHPIQVDFLPLASLRGRVGLSLAPGKRDGFYWERDLGADIDRLVAHYRVTHLVCLLEEHELIDYGIPDLSREAERRGLVVERFPIRDVSVPPDLDQVTHLIERISGWVKAGQTVLIHCLGGLGRTGTIAGCFLVAQGFDPEEALDVLAAVRDARRCPETRQQRDFIREYGRRLKATLYRSASSL